MSRNIYVEGRKWTANLHLRGDKVVILGNSSTGKTLIADVLMTNAKDDRQRGIKDSPYYDIYVINVDTENAIDAIKSLKNKLIIIDNADIILDNEIINIINSDETNNYIIIGRKLYGLEIMPNYVGELKETDKGNGRKHLELKYLYDNNSWW